MIHNRVGAELLLLSCLSERYAHPYYWAPFIQIGNWN
jgi:CHAT domain-containing protein